MSFLGNDTKQRQREIEPDPDTCCKERKQAWDVGRAQTGGKHTQPEMFTLSEVVLPNLKAETGESRRKQ